MVEAACLMTSPVHLWFQLNGMSACKMLETTLSSLLCAVEFHSLYFISVFHFHIMEKEERFLLKNLCFALGPKLTEKASGIAAANEEASAPAFNRRRRLYVSGESVDTRENVGRTDRQLESSPDVPGAIEFLSFKIQGVQSLRSTFQLTILRLFKSRKMHTPLAFRAVR